MLFIVFPNHHISNPTAYHDALLKSDSFEPPWPHQPSTIPWLPLPPQVENHSWNFWGQPQNSATKLGFLLHYFYSLPTRVEIKPRGLPFFQFMNLGIPKLKWFKWFTNKSNRNTTKSKGLFFLWDMVPFISVWNAHMNSTPMDFGVTSPKGCQTWCLSPKLPGAGSSSRIRWETCATPVGVCPDCLFDLFVGGHHQKQRWEREIYIYIYLFIILYA